VRQVSLRAYTKGPIVPHDGSSSRFIQLALMCSLVPASVLTAWLPTLLTPSLNIRHIHGREAAGAGEEV
jgi:hypothetical protein